MTSLLKKVLQRPLWQEPATAIVLRMMDPADWIARRVKGYSDLPPFSRRVRSNGLTRQFGGARFAAEGNHLVEQMRKLAGLTPASHVLEIGCGVGRSAIALAKYLETGRYVGMDIERVSIEAFRGNPALKRENFTVEWLNIYNELYNPEGSQAADEYRFSHVDGTFDLIFHFSVFTHMMEEDVRNYVAEMARMTAPGGYCLFSGFLMNHDRATASAKMPFQTGAAYHMREDIPTVMIGYEEAFWDGLFAEHGMQKAHDSVLGTWRGEESSVKSSQIFAQDILIYTRPA